jgi:hypothetical protein
MLLLIRPFYFTANIQAISTNLFISKNIESIQEAALNEHNSLLTLLKQNNIQHTVYDNLNPETPDAVFANNWISVHPNQNIMIIYPMHLENRRKEIREDIINDILNFYPSMKLVNLTNSKQQSLEGTGSMVFDHENQTIYAAISQRTSELLVKNVASILNYKLITFYTRYKSQPIYHTNVMMAIGKTWIVICLEIIDPDDLRELNESLKASKKQIIPIYAYQMEAFCGNILEIYDKNKKPYTIMSTKAYENFNSSQRTHLGSILHVALDTIENYGGGGIRCCLTEIIKNDI